MFIWKEKVQSIGSWKLAFCKLDGCLSQWRLPLSAPPKNTTTSSTVTTSPLIVVTAPSKNKESECQSVNSNASTSVMKV